MPVADRARAPLAAIVVLAAGLAVTLAGCSPPAQPAPSPYASAEQVEENFRNQRFILGDNDQTAEVRPVDWPADRYLKLPFWLGINILVPGVMQPREGNYYVISQARLLRPLDRDKNTWLVAAGSHLVKQEAVFVTTRTHYFEAGTILPTIVQFSGMREFKTGDRTSVKLPVLREVSLPMEWTLKGAPVGYARYSLR